LTAAAALAVGGAQIPLIAGLAALAPRYDALLCDAWGVLIDGEKHFPAAAAALENFRAGGGVVVLVTNASRPSAEVRRQLLRLGAPESCFDDLISAGELALREIVARAGRIRPQFACHHLGPPRDHGLFDAAREALGDQFRLVPAEQADFVVCTGLVDERREQPEDYDSRLAAMLARGLPFVCANPDIIVEVGAERLYCAGAIAARYAAMGGEVLMFGKPHPPIYGAAIARLAELRGAPVETARILAIGDGAMTDLAGARRAGVDCLFVTEGVHRDELSGSGGGIDAGAAAALFSAAGGNPAAMTRALVW
jgi:HAD superfamily hydrolase (TIGR01459 family)